MSKAGGTMKKNGFVPIAEAKTMNQIVGTSHETDFSVSASDISSFIFKFVIKIYPN